MSFRLEEMTTEDKLKAMEVLWDDICRNLPDFSSPAWHENILKEREQRWLTLFIWARVKPFNQVTEVIVVGSFKM